MSQTALRNSIARKAGPTWAASHKTFNNTTTSTTNSVHPLTTHFGAQTTQKPRADHCAEEAIHAHSPSPPPTTPSLPPKPTSSTLSYPHSMGSPSQKNGKQHSPQLHPQLRGAKKTTSSRASYRMRPQALLTSGGTSPAKEASPSKAIPLPPLDSFLFPHSSAISMETYKPT